MKTRSQLPADQARLARMFKALGNPVRFQIMQRLAERQTCITQEIVDAMPLAQSTVSQHLKVLREAGLIRGEIEGPATCYCIDAEGMRWLKEQIEGWLPGCCAPIKGRGGAEIPLIAPPREVSGVHPSGVERLSL